jgi:hypothetical protein
MQGPAPGTEPIPGAPNIPVLRPFTRFPGVEPPTTTEGLGIQPISIAPTAAGVVYGEEHLVPENQYTSADGAFPVSKSNGPYPAVFQAAGGTLSLRRGNPEWHRGRRHLGEPIP